MPYDGSNVTSETARVLLDARALLEKGWCRGYLAKDARGLSVSYDFKAATQFCIIGALSRVAVGESYVRANKRLAFALYGKPGRVGMGLLVDFNNAQNDSAPILALFDRAVEAELSSSM